MAAAIPRLHSVAALCFGAQVFVDRRERVALHLPFATFDPALERLHGVAVRDGFELASLVRIARDHQPHTHVATRIDLHVGSVAIGDVHEARLFELAVADETARATAEKGSAALTASSSFLDLATHRCSELDFKRYGH